MGLRRSVDVTGHHFMALQLRGEVSEDAAPKASPTKTIVMPHTLNDGGAFVGVSNECVVIRVM